MPVNTASMNKIIHIKTLYIMSNIKVFAMQDGWTDSGMDGQMEKHDQLHRSICFSYEPKLVLLCLISERHLSK